MKKLLLQLVFLLLPFLAFAQDEASVIKDFREKTKGIADIVKLNEHMYVMMINLEDQNFEMVAVDDKMNDVWHATFKGSGIAVGKFKGSILAIACADQSRSRGFTGPYSAYLIDEQSGKLKSQKVIYQSNVNSAEVPEAFFNEDGSDFTLTIRETGITKSFSPFAQSKYRNTKDFTVIKLNEKLDVNTYKPSVPLEGYAGATVNYKGDLCIFSIQDDKTLKASKYDPGKTQPSSSIVQDIDIKKNVDLEFLNCENIPSTTDQNIFYFASVHKNPNSDYELTVAKLNFANGSGTVVNELFNSAHVKEIEKGFVPLDKKWEKPSIGPVNELDVNYMKEYNGTLLVGMASSFYHRLGSVLQLFVGATVINGYDLKLKRNFQQVLPINYNYDFRLPLSYHLDGNSLYIVGNTAVSYKMGTLYSQLDLNTGNWSKMQGVEIEKRWIASENTLWFKDNFIQPFIKYSGLLPPPKQAINLQLITY